jgi:hypothetical protein
MPFPSNVQFARPYPLLGLEHDFKEKFLRKYAGVAEPMPGPTESKWFT